MLALAANHTLRLRPMATVTAGVDLGGTKIQTIVADGDYNGHRAGAAPDAQGRRPGRRRRRDRRVLREAAAQAGVEPCALRGVGIGSPGAVDARRHRPERPQRHARLDGAVPTGPRCREATGAPVALGNDVTVGTEAEYVLGAGARVPSLLGVFWGTGVGGGIILDGKPWVGRGAAGEIGHMVVEPGGARCTVRAARLHGGLRRPQGDGAEARHRVEKGAQTKLFKIMEKRGRERLSSGIWARALQRGGPAWPSTSSTAPWRHWAPALPRPSTCWTWRRS